MNISVRFLRAALAAAAVVAAGACGDDDVDIVDPEFQGGDTFRSYVSLGNSITAGYQSSGINDSTQRESYAYLFAGALYGADFASRWHYPSLANPGCPPPVTNIQTGARVRISADTASTPTTCRLRTAAGVTTTINNVAVPNAFSIDPTQPTTENSNALTTLVLGGSSQVSRALQAQPTFASVWIGNNDVLSAAATGLLVRTPTTVTATAPLVSSGITRDSIFKANYKLVVDSLKLAPTLQGAALIGVVNPLSAPVLFPVAALFNPTFKAGFDQFAGGATTILASCGTAAAPSGALVSFAILSAMRAGTHPRTIACAPLPAPNAAVGNTFIVDATEQATITAAVTSFNAYIQAQAVENDWIYLDPNTVLTQLRATPGCINTVPNLASATQTFGSCISLDGVHPRRPAHVAVANALIALVNTKYAVTIPTVQ
jgi:lysophospholipase L1-like esterase